MCEEKSIKCGGACCSRMHFIPNLSPSDLIRFAVYALKGEFEAASGILLDGGSHYTENDAEFILNLKIIGIGESPEIECAGESSFHDRENVYLYKCGFLTGEGLCGNYENRPWLCRIHPSNGICRYRGCKEPIAII